MGAAGSNLAAIVLEPVVERLPSKEWINRARELATASGSVLIFDEIKTGFRLATGGYQAYADVMPDLAAFGKAMANGFPLAAVVGHREVMDAARKTWISSTLASEASALAAAGAVLAWHDQADVCESLWTIGAEMRGADHERRSRRAVHSWRDDRWHRPHVDAALRSPRARTTFPRARRGARRVVQARRVQLCGARARRGRDS